MNSEQLALFLRVASSRNLSRAAMEVGVSQSALSRKISTLEKELKTRLFYRSGRGVTLTESGRQLEKYATDICGRLETATREMSEAVSSGPSSIIIAAPPTIARLLFGILGKKLKSAYPAIRVHLKESVGGNILEWLADGEIDAAIVYLPPGPPPSFKIDLLIRDHMNFVAPPEFGPLGASFPVERVADIPLIMPTRPNGLRVLMESLMIPHSKKLNISMECDASIHVTKQLVMEGCGCTILSKASVQDEVTRGLLQAVPLSDPDVVREVGLVVPKNRPPIVDQRQIIETARAEVITLAEKGLWPGAEVIS